MKKHNYIYILYIYRQKRYQLDSQLISQHHTYHSLRLPESNDIRKCIKMYLDIRNNDIYLFITSTIYFLSENKKDNKSYKTI